MEKNLIKHAAAVIGAIATTFVLFSAVAGLADGDRALLLAAKAKPTLVAEGNAGSVQR
ncbi:MAG TPA: hypothetical protein PLE54_16670 [Burkholderiaceae bacterium]|nr:hypothetical protein [Burkholderiaceae bacterium]HQR72241.1 hypothetical protein [Burkholderiaceae bacterium]